jgi:very-short-patch-repair endonuclease
MFQIDSWQLVKGIFFIFYQFWWFWLGLIVAAIILRELPYIIIFFVRKVFPKHNSHQPTPEVKKLGKMLESYGWKVELEKFDGYKHIDIAIPEVKVDIEVDGNQHNWSRRQALADLKRTYYSFKKGYLTLRIPNVLVRDEETAKTTANFIDKFLKEGELK